MNDNMMDTMRLDVKEKSPGKEASKDGWGGWRGYMDVKRGKLLQQQEHEPYRTGPSTGQPQALFKGISIHVNGFTVPSADELKRLVLSHGGSYHHYHDPRTTTHVIATCLPNSKLKNLRKQNVVRPEWIVDCIQEGKLVPHQNYNLYESTQKRLNFGPQPANAAQDLNSEAMAYKDEQKTTGTCSVDRENVSLLKEFYGRSRLHHISTMGTEFRQHVSRLREVSDGTFSGLPNLERWLSVHGKENCSASDGLEELDRRCIMHIDMDCFFVSVGLRDRPELRDKPVAVTHSRGGKGGPAETGSTSEIACCNYSARKSGVRNGSWMGDAKQLCPDLVTIPYDFDGYKDVAWKLYSIVASYTLDIEAVSCDEMYVDCSRLLEKTGATPQQFASCLRNHVFEETRCTASVGIARNFILARMATRKAKPNGQLILLPNKESDLLLAEDVTSLPGVGRSLGKRLNAMSVLTCADLQAVPLHRLKSDFGPKMGQTLYNMCRGIDDRVINQNGMRHSVSAEMNYGIRLNQFTELQKLLKEVAEEVQSRLQKIPTKGKTITLKMKVRKPEAPIDTVKYMGHGICDSLSRAVTLAREVDDAAVIAAECVKLYNNLDVVVSDIRGVGIQVSRLMNKETCKPLNTMNKFLSSGKTDSTMATSAAGPSYKEEGRSFTPLPDTSSKLILSPKSTKGKKPSPKKPSPAKEVPFKYLAMDRHFISHGRQMTCSRPELETELTVANHTHIPVKMARDVRIETDDEFGQRQLGPAMSFEEMATLFKEWTETFDVPLDDDLDMIKECIVNAVHDRELEKVNSVLQTLRRLIGRKRGLSMAWRSAYNDVVSRTQDVVMELHGGQLTTLTPF